MVSLMSNDAMIAYWKAHGFEDVILVDAKAFDDGGQDGAYVDSTRFSQSQRLAFQAAVLKASIARPSRRSAASSRRSSSSNSRVLACTRIGAKAHNLYPADTLDAEHIIDGLQRRALNAEAWTIVRDNLQRAGGGPAAKTVATERERALPDLGALPLQGIPAR